MYPRNIAQYNKIHDPLNNKMAAKEVKDESISTQMVEDDSKQHVSTELDSCDVVIKRPLPLLLQLQQNADLNQPPPNWLRRHSGAGNYFQHSLFSQFNRTPSSTELCPSSIALASYYPNDVGEMDVIADAKNIKKLLTLPYSQSDVSMAIHRVGKTLLIDELVPEMVFSRSLKKLVCDEELPQLYARKKDPASSHHRSMYSKLLYYSIEDQPSHPMLPAPQRDTGEETLSEGASLSINLETMQNSGAVSLPLVVREVTKDVKETESVSPEIIAGPYVEEVSDDRHFPYSPPNPPTQPFHLNVKWTIRDIRMLLGSDLPIFGRGGQPAISLRLRDMQKPITVLTGLDYWLDNLMCNVPELAMCFHLNGIVQKYEVIKTEDIPNLDKNSQFSPQEVLEVAQNILSFLKANCTREGHTYWLFRPKGKDIVKLYDLTTLTSTDDSAKGEQEENPFAKNVAVLFYRVSQRMLQYGPHTGKDLATIKLLLENCIKLLHNDTSSQIVMSSFYLLANLVLNYTPTSTSPPTSSSSEEEEEEEEEESIQPQCVRSKSYLVTGNEPQLLSVSHLTENKPNVSLYQPPIQPLVFESQQDRARTALSYIASAFVKCDAEKLEGWQLEGVCQLLQKACHAYWLLADMAMTLNKLGRCLKYSRLCILCCKVAIATREGIRHVNNKPTIEDTLFQSWQLCGDVHLLSTKVSESLTWHLEDFNSIVSDDSKITTFVHSLYNPTADEEECLQLHTDLETSLQKSIDCYKLCETIEHQIEGDKAVLKERIGNAWNEMGVYYKLIASALDLNTDSKQIEKLWTSSYCCLKNGIASFEATSNVSNQALLNANLGSLMRSCAEAYGLLKYPVKKGSEEKTKGEFSSQEKLYYNRAIEYYMRGKEVLKRPSTHPGIWLNIECDLAGVYYEMGQQMQERPPFSSLSLQEIEREILSHLMKSLHCAESILSSAECNVLKYQTLSQIIGDCHHRLASLYHKNAFDTSVPLSQKMKQARTQAEKHYTKALQSYLIEYHQCQIMRVYLEKALLLEQQANASTSKLSTRLLQQSLETLLNITKVFEKSIPADEKSSKEESFIQLVAILMQRLQTVLKQLLSISLKKGEDSTVYREMYSIALKSNITSSSDSMISLLLDTLLTLHQVYNKAR